MLLMQTFNYSPLSALLEHNSTTESVNLQPNTDQRSEMAAAAA